MNPSLSAGESVIESAFRDQPTRRATYLLLFIVALLVRVACFTGLIGSDDLGYSYFAQVLSRGANPLPVSHLGFRIGLIFPVSAAYSVSGLSEWATVLFPLLASAASVPLLVAVGRRLVPSTAAMIAGLLLLTFPVHVRYASVLIPEPLMEFWILAGVLAYLAAVERRGILLGIMSGACFSAAYLTKEPSIFVAGALMLFSLLHREWKPMFGLVAGLVLVLGAEQSYYLLRTGDLFFRAHVTAAESARYALQNPEPMPYRILKEYPREMLVPNLDFGIHSLITLLIAVPGMFLTRRKSRNLLLLWAAIPLLYLNFGSSSLSKYIVLPAAPRYVGLVYAPVFLLAGAAVWSFLQRGRAARTAAVTMMFVVSAVGFACAYSTRGQGYRAPAVTALRVIAEEAKAGGYTVQRISGKDAPYWNCALNIIVGARAPASCEKKCVAVSEDLPGMPSVSDAAGLEQGEPVSPESCAQMVAGTP